MVGFQQVSVPLFVPSETWGNFEENQLTLLLGKHSKEHKDKQSYQSFITLSLYQKDATQSDERF